MNIPNLDNLKRIKLTRLATQQSTLLHTRYFFKEIYNRRFVTNSHHQYVCEVLDRVIKGELVKVMINIAPRYGKTELAVKNFISHGLSINPAAKFIHLSYSTELALDNSEAVKDIIEHESFKEIFPEVVIKNDSKAKKKWYTTAGGGVYATSTGGQVTGFGAGTVDDDEQFYEEEFEDEFSQLLESIGINQTFGGALIIDDPIKPEDADSEIKRNRVNNRYDSTIKNRVNSRNTPIIIMMQRVHEDDLCGYLLKNEPGEWFVLSLPCIQVDDEGNRTALWEFKHTLAELDDMNSKNPLVFGRQYMQNPMPAGGYLYQRPWKTYEITPFSRRKIRKTYTDTADTGSDYLCSIAYEETETAMYVLDIIYTQAPMETTEPLTAKQLFDFDINLARVESNNGGRGFARNVEQQTRLAGNKKTNIEWFHQSGNKQVRIFTNASSVQNLIYFPSDWESRWPIFAKHIKQYLAVGINAHDDAEDCLTGMVEFFGVDNVGPQNLTKLF
ncbi:phage terminase large subunit [Flectobacillus sp. DC10W]|uniref:Phage terminase large subunit n=1 Tax=Flectobacillus longus TaxID=2984207 RepID=A0ABT6YK57_9BACT|nr:phage terminase large subunit [Flectobacillus longus]MDI9863972.1 phage terminase large subunit [Flectobacillus longus]